jgi:hypothetical protein
MKICAVTGRHPFLSKRYWQKWLLRRIHWIGQNVSERLEYRIYLYTSDNIFNELCWSSLVMLNLNFCGEDVCDVREATRCGYCPKCEETKE